MRMQSVNSLRRMYSCSAHRFSTMASVQARPSIISPYRWWMSLAPRALLGGRQVAFSTKCSRLGSSHENPLGLPRSGTPPNLAARMQRGLPTKQPIPNVGKTVAVSSAKGGVGKSTISVNLALALSQRGIRTGILDVDVYGPSIPTLLNLENLEPALDSKNRLIPLTSYGLQAMSMGFLVPQDSPIAWRGLMLQKAVNQLLYEVSWADLEVLILDLPPGTGDVQLTVTQNIELAGAIVVSTPQDLALRDAQRGIDFFYKTSTPILGMVQNMSTFICSGCGHRHDIFGTDGAATLSTRRNIPLLGDVPLHASICRDADAGRPTCVSDPNGQQARAFQDIAAKLIEKLGI